MDISEQRHLKTQLERDVEALADYMDTVDNSDGHFDMGVVTHKGADPRHPFGTPGCAMGHAWTALPEVALRLFCGTAKEKLDFATGDLFGVQLTDTIKTPSEWSAHARAWLGARKAKSGASA